MYSLVLMAALSNGAAAPIGLEPTATKPTPTYASHGHRQNRGRRCNGCSGGCSGGCGGCYGGYGGCHGCSGGGYGCRGGRGCCGGYGSYGGYSGGYYGSYSASYGAGSNMPYGYSSGYYNPETAEGQAESPATIRVQVPAGTKLFVDNKATQSTATTREFITPPLERGKSFSYDLRAEMVRDGKPVTVNKRVTVRAGEETPIQISFPETGKNEQ